MVDLSLLESFEAKAQELLGASSLAGLWRLDRQRNSINLTIAASSADGFDVGATCETYGLYPWAGDWRDDPWEPVHWSVGQLCDEYFGLVRMLVSRDARLRLVYRRNHLQAAVVELRTPEGWRLFEEERRIALPFGERRELFLQNDHLPPRFPFVGLHQGLGRVYLWRDRA